MTQFPPSGPPGGWPPTPSQAGWHPDPSGRHEHRYWDGVRWTDHVADGGVESVDPFSAGGGAPQGAGPSSFGTAGGPPGPGQYGAYPSGPQPPAGGQRSRSGPSPALLIVAALLAVALIGGVAFLLTRDDDGDDETSTDNDATVEQFATQLEQVYGGIIDNQQATCIAEGFLDAFGLERLAEIGQANTGIAGLSAEEQQAAVETMTSCVDPETLAEMGQVAPGSTGG